MSPAFAKLFKLTIIPLAIFSCVYATLNQLLPEPIQGWTSEKTSLEMEPENINLTSVKIIDLAGYLSAVDEVGDSQFSTFVSKNLDERCPFYEPNGIAYRDCLYAFAEEQRALFKGSEAKIEEVEQYCNLISEKYFPSLKGIELYNWCLAYKFS